jgi:hypothetical protein
MRSVKAQITPLASRDRQLAAHHFMTTNVAFWAVKLLEEIRAVQAIARQVGEYRHHPADN